MVLAIVASHQDPRPLQLVVSIPSFALRRRLDTSNAASVVKVLYKNHKSQRLKVRGRQLCENTKTYSSLKEMLLSWRTQKLSQTALILLKLSATLEDLFNSQQLSHLPVGRQRLSHGDILDCSPDLSHK